MHILLYYNLFLSPVEKIQPRPFPYRCWAGDAPTPADLPACRGSLLSVAAHQLFSMSYWAVYGPGARRYWPLRFQLV